MKAIGYYKPLAVNARDSLLDIELPQPIATGHDLLVRIHAISVNPVDYKIRQTATPTAGEARVLGWDAVGEVIACGESSSRFRPGDKVFYAGDINRQGCNAEYQLVDERLVGRKPQSLSDAEAAALPLTAITAWEMLFEHLGIQRRHAHAATESGELILLVGAAGGVGSIFLQLVKALTNATVIATASRQSSQAWARQRGARYVINHSQALPPQIQALGVGQITHVASLNATDAYFDSYTELLAPFGRIALIDDPESLDISKLKAKSLSLHWQFMFARSMFQADDMDEQGQLLNTVSELVDQGLVHTTAAKNLGTIKADNLRAAHEELESGRAIGKIVLEGFD